MFKVANYLRYVFIALLLIAIIVLANLYKKANKIFNVAKVYDVSVDQVKQCSTNKAHNIWLASYADGEVHIANQRALVVSALNRCVDFFLPYNPTHLDAKFVSKNHEILKQPRGAGYWLWKPYVILKAMKQIPRGDFLLYVDSGSLLKNNVEKLIEKLGDKDILLFNNSYRMEPYTKSYILLRNTPQAQKFIEQWLYWAQIPGAIDNSPSESELPSFIEHRHDQSILCILYYTQEKNGIFKILEADEIEKFFIYHRRREIHYSVLNKKELREE